MNAKETKHDSNKPAAAILNADENFDAKDEQQEPATGRLRSSQKRNDEQQYHAGGIPHDPHQRTQKRIDKESVDAGDLEEVDRSDDAPFNKTYGEHK